MPAVSEIVYTPRQDVEIAQDFEKGKLPLEIKEIMAMPDKNSPEMRKLEEVIQKIAAKIIDGNKLDPETFTLNIQISADQRPNAVIYPSIKPPLLILTAGLLINARTEDELAGVIAHEFGHKLLNDKVSTQKGRTSKVEELGADAIAVKLLEDAGYNPRGALTLLERIGEDNFQIINIDDIRSAESLAEQGALLKQLADPHPSDSLRIRSMENAIVALDRSRGKLGTDRAQIKLEKTFFNSVLSLEYETPLEAGLRKIGYINLPEDQKIDVLTTLVKSHWLPTDQISANRLEAIAGHIAALRVDFNVPAQAEAFTRLADPIMGKFTIPKGKELVFPSGSSAGSNIQQTLYPALQMAWAKGHGKGLTGRQQQTYIHVGRVNDLKTAVERFVHAKNAMEAEQSAQQIVEASDKLATLYKRIDHNGFYPPKEEAVREEIKRTGSWTPPYKKHVEWYRETKSENIRKILWGMSLATDPWVAGIIGPKPHGWGYAYDLPTLPTKEGYKTTVAGFEDANYKYMTTLDRADDGRITGILEPVPGYDWKRIAPDADEKKIVILHTGQARNREAYDRKIAAEADWTLLKSDFPRFIAKYGASIVPSQSLVPVTYPFAERFFKELKSALQNADEQYKRQVSDFLWGTYRGIDDSAHGYTEQILASFYTKGGHQWPYTKAKDPNIYTLDHPLIQFITSEPGKSLVSDYSKINLFAQTRDFITPDERKRFGKIFVLPVQDILNYPHADSLAGLVDQMATGEYTSIAIAAEAERLGETLGAKMSLEDVFVLDKIALSSASYPKLGDSSLLFFKIYDTKRSSALLRPTIYKTSSRITGMPSQAG